MDGPLLLSALSNILMMSTARATQAHHQSARSNLFFECAVPGLEGRCHADLSDVIYTHA